MNRLEEIEARVNAATFGPGKTVLVYNVAEYQQHCCRDVPYLLDKLKRAVEVIEFAEMALLHSIKIIEGPIDGYHILEGTAKIRDFLKEMRDE